MIKSFGYNAALASGNNYVGFKANPVERRITAELSKDFSECATIKKWVS